MKADAPRADKGAGHRANAGETVLLVEDDMGVREYATGVLQDLGYAVLAASHGTEALQMLSWATGKQLADKIAKLRPALPVLFTTGYTRNAIVHHGRLDAGVQLLDKPYTKRDLALKVRELLDFECTAV